MTTSSTFFTILLRQIDVVGEYVECVLQRKLEFSSLVGRGDGRITARRGITGVGIVGNGTCREIEKLGRNATTTRAATTTIGECIYITAAAAAASP